MHDDRENLKLTSATNGMMFGEAMMYTVKKI